MLTERAGSPRSSKIALDTIPLPEEHVRLARKVLVLYSMTGAGHWRVSQAIVEQIRFAAPDCTVVLREGLDMLSSGRKINPSRIHFIFTTRVIWLLNVVFVLGATSPGLSFFTWVTRILFGRRLGALIEAEQPDLIVNTHPLIHPSVCVTRSRLPRWMTVVTDLARPHRVWFDPRCDAIVVATPEAAERGRQFGVRPDRLFHLDYGYPVDARFSRTERAQPPCGTLLIVGGGAGSGSIREQVAVLTRAFPKKKVVVVCGRHRALEKELREQAGKQLEVHGFVDSIDRLMYDADVILTKAGPGTIVEAALMGKPLIITGWVGLQERDNVAMVTDLGLGVYCPEPRDLPAAVEHVLRNDEMYRRGDRVFRPGAEQIARLLLPDDASLRLESSSPVPTTVG